MSTTQNNLEKIRKEELKALREKLGLHEFIKFLQSYSEGKGDYTEERREILKDIKIEDVQEFLREELD